MRTQWFATIGVLLVAVWVVRGAVGWVGALPARWHNATGKKLYERAQFEGALLERV